MFVLGDFLQEINPDIKVTPNKVKIMHDNAQQHFQKYDVILDCTDNFPSRYLISDACVLLNKPDVYASVYRFDGHVSVFSAGGPCYRCLNPNPPKPGSIQTCVEGGILGTTAGIAGLMQATEAIKIILGMDAMKGRLLFFNAGSMYFQEAKLPKRENCPACSGMLKQLIDYDEFCGVKAIPLSASVVLDNVPVREKPIEPSASNIEVSPKEAREKLEDGAVIVDVREPSEREIAKIDNTMFIPLGELAGRSDELPRNKLIIAHCHHGVRSMFAAELLRGAGFDAYSMKGGIDEWSLQIDNSVPRYD